MHSPGIALVTRKTRYAGLMARWATRGQARFLLKAAKAQEIVRLQSKAGPEHLPNARALDELAEQEFQQYEQEDETYQLAVERVEQQLDFGVPVHPIDRDFLPNFDFRSCQVVVVLGQDGLVANTAKYAAGLPIVAVNPDPRQFDGVLLPFRAGQVRSVVGRALEGRAPLRQVTLAEVQLNDGQRMLAFNDFFIGCAGHTSARYLLRLAGQSEPQSSSGVLVSTGAGSTGWFSSVFNMACGVAGWRGAQAPQPISLPWEDRRLLWAVREPFVSKSSQANLVAGLLEAGQELVIESQMPAQGVIFSDGIESDFLSFTSGAIAQVRASPHSAHLVVP